MPIFVWWAIAIAIGIIAGRVAIDKETPVQQIIDPINQILGNGIEIISCGIVIALLIVAVGYAIKSSGKGGGH